MFDFESSKKLHSYNARRQLTDSKKNKHRQSSRPSLVLELVARLV
jgi:hypothetical protein